VTQVKIASGVRYGRARGARRIELITADVEVGQVYEARSAALMDFGAFVISSPAATPGAHPQISNERVGRVTTSSRRDVIRVKVPRSTQGRIRLSMRDVRPAERPVAPF